MPEYIATLRSIRRLRKLLHCDQIHESWKSDQLYIKARLNTPFWSTYKEDYSVGRARATRYALPKHRASWYQTEQHNAQWFHWKCWGVHRGSRKLIQNGKRWGNKKVLDWYQRLHCSRNAQKQTLQFLHRHLGFGHPNVPPDVPENAILPWEWQEKSKVNSRATSWPWQQEYLLLHWRSKRSNWRDVIKGSRQTHHYLQSSWTSVVSH